MSNAPLPNQIDVRKLAVKGAEINTKAPINSLPRLLDLLVDERGSVEVNLQFYIDEQRIKCVEGQLKAEVNVTCQRCLEPMVVPIENKFHLGIVWSEEDSERLPESLEPLIVGEDELIDLSDVVSEELILGLPFVNYHKPEECRQIVGYQSADPDAPNEFVKEERDNPFKVLEQFKFDK